MMPDLDELERAFARAERMLADAERDFSKLPSAVATLLRVYSAQGIIDNGGYVYFFESDWEDQPPYDVFADAYAAIGCATQAADLRRVAATFPFPDPQLRCADRRAFIEALFDEETHEVQGWGDALCGDRDVWERLAEYCHDNAREFADGKCRRSGRLRGLDLRHDETLAALKAEVLEGMREYMIEAEPGYDAADIERCATLLDRYLDGLSVAETEGDALECVRSTVVQLNELNGRCDGTLIETDQRELICALISRAGSMRGLLGEDEDVTERWREW